MNLALELTDDPRCEVAGGKMSLTIDVHDSEVIAELARRRPGMERDRYAVEALRIGVLALRHANGSFDVDALRRQSEQLMAQVRETLLTHGAQVAQSVGGALQHYFDPREGLVPERLERLVRPGGELEQLMKRHVDGDHSLLAQTLAAHVGEQSPLLRTLSPDEKAGVLCALRETIERLLGDQRSLLLHEFSLDHTDSALSRLVAEFSGARPDSFGSRFQKMLEETQAAVSRNLTLDDDASPLARMRRELTDIAEREGRSNQDFRAQVIAALASLQTRRAEDARTITHGRTFENALEVQLRTETQRLGDLLEVVKDSPGALARCKMGDFVIQTSADTLAGGTRIVVEAKDDRSYDVTKALQELAKARENRRATLGVFVFARGSAPAGMAPLMRYHNDIIVVWDAEAPESDAFLRGGLLLVRALAVSARQDAKEPFAGLAEMERAVTEMLRHIDDLDGIRTAGDSVRSQGVKIGEKADALRVRLQKYLEVLEANLQALRDATPTTE